MSTAGYSVSYELALMSALRALLNLKSSMPRSAHSLAALQDTWDFLTWWADDGKDPDLTRVPVATREWVTMVITLRRSRAVRDPSDAGDDGLEWLVELLGLINSAISDPGDDCSDLEQGEGVNEVRK